MKYVTQGHPILPETLFTIKGVVISTFSNLINFHLIIFTFENIHRVCARCVKDSQDDAQGNAQGVHKNVCRERRIG